MSELESCRRRIKEWERGFTAEIGRLPSKRDIKADVEIRKAYKRYQLLKSKANKSKEVQIEENVDSVNISLTDESDIEPLEPAQNAELGPTPQANGKVLSIFDIIPSPPESSPVSSHKPNSNRAMEGLEHELLHQAGDLPNKRLNESPRKQKSNNLFKTPTKAVKPVLFPNLTPSRSSDSLSSRLRMAALQNTPKTEASGSETPFYLGKANSRFTFDEASPAKSRRSKALPAQKLEPGTPTRTTISFQVSPSPLKLQRVILFGGAKRVSTLFSELQNLLKDEAYESEKLKIEAELCQNEEKKHIEESEDGIKAESRRKAKTQKRTTRRWKMKPKEDGSAEDTFEGKDVHEELAKMNEKGLLDDELSKQKSDEEPPQVVKRAPSSVFKPISNNFKRLKINDPRTKKFKQRKRR